MTFFCATHIFRVMQKKLNYRFKNYAEEKLKNLHFIISEQIFITLFIDKKK